MTDDDRQRRIELNDLHVLIIERPDTTDGQLVQRSPKAASVFVILPALGTAAHIVKAIFLLQSLPLIQDCFKSQAARSREKPDEAIGAGDGE